MEASLPALVARLVGSLAVVVLLMVVAGRVLRSRSSFGAAARGRTPPIEVLARQGFGRNASVALVRAGGRALVIGVTDSRVTLLAEADPEALVAGTPSPGTSGDGPPGAHRTALPAGDRPGPSWKATLEQVRERTVRRS